MLYSSETKKAMQTMLTSSTLIGKDNDTIENLDDSEYHQDECLVGQHDGQIWRGERVERKLQTVSTHPQAFLWWHFVYRWRGNKLFVTTVFLDTGLLKTKHPRKRFQNSCQSCMLSADGIEVHQSQPLV